MEYTAETSVKHGLEYASSGTTHVEAAEHTQMNQLSTQKDKFSSRIIQRSASSINNTMFTDNRIGGYDSSARSKHILAEVNSIRQSMRCHSDLSFSRGSQKVSVARERYLSTIERSKNGKSISTIDEAVRVIHNPISLKMTIKHQRCDSDRSINRGVKPKSPTMKHFRNIDSSITVATEYSSSVSFSDEETDPINDLDSIISITPTGNSCRVKDRSDTFESVLMSPEDDEASRLIYVEDMRKEMASTMYISSMEFPEHPYVDGVTPSSSKYDVASIDTLRPCPSTAQSVSDCSASISLNSLRSRMERAKSCLMSPTESYVPPQEGKDVSGPDSALSTAIASADSKSMWNSRDRICHARQLLSRIPETSLHIDVTSESSTNAIPTKKSSVEIWAMKFEKRQTKGFHGRLIKSKSCDLSCSSVATSIHPIRHFYSKTDTGLSLHLYPSLTRDDLLEIYGASSL